MAELPPIAVRVSEHRLHRVCCPACAAVTTADASRSVAMGVRAAAAGGDRHAGGAQPGLAPCTRPSSPASCSGSSSRPGRSTRSCSGPARRSPRRTRGWSRRSSAPPVVNIDETGWKTSGERRTLWGALTRQTAVFRIAAGRHASEAQTMLGERYDGIVCSDRYAGYDYLDPTRRQLCWAHLLRDFTAHSEGMGEQAQFGAAGLAVATTSSTPGSSSSKTVTGPALRRRIKPLQAKLRAELEHASRKSARTKYHRQFARNLLKRWPALWTFTHTDGVEPTNNHAERGLRGAVIYRKLSLGTQSERGERSIERLLSASITCRLRKQSLFAYLTQVITAHARGDPIPSPQLTPATG